MADCFAGGWVKDANARGRVAGAIVRIDAYCGDLPQVSQDARAADAHGAGSLRTW